MRPTAGLVDRTRAAKVASPDAGKSNSLASVGSFVGREGELERLRASLQGVLDGCGRLVLLAGEPGIGKTRTAEELARYAHERGMNVAWGRCWEEAGAPDLWPWMQVIRTCLRSVDEEILRELIGPHGNELTALVAPLHASRPEAEATPESPAVRFRLFNAIAHFLDAYAERTPLLVILDDLHRADPASLLLLQFFTQEQRQRRILLVAIYREPCAVPNRALLQTVIEALREPGTERLGLGNLSAADTERLLQSSLETEPEAELVDGLHLRTGGNPLLLTECARQLRALTDSNGRRLTASATNLPIPAELCEFIEQRLAPLSEDERHVLRVAATLGRDFRRAAVDRLLAASANGERTGVQGDPTSAALSAAERLGLVLRGTEAGSHRFAQDMVRELLSAEVPALHRNGTRPCAEPRPSDGAPRAPGAVQARAEAFVFRKEGEYWTVTFAERTCRIKDVKGLAYVALLLRHPGKPLHVTELVNLGGMPADCAETETSRGDESTAVRVDLGDSGVVLDDQARADYRRRLEDLRSELEEASTFHDAGRAERVQAEIDFLTQELSAAIGLGGRVRRAGSHTERARVNVTRSVARALERIAESHPELAGHLGRTIRTGTFCVYATDRLTTTAWEL